MRTQEFRRILRNGRRGEPVAQVFRLVRRLSEPGPQLLLPQQDLTEQLLRPDDAEDDLPRLGGLLAGVAVVDGTGVHRNEATRLQLPRLQFQVELLVDAHLRGGIGRAIDRPSLRRHVFCGIACAWLCRGRRF
jgi:hypothetical protein